jgi:hypothetical protein
VPNDDKRLVYGIVNDNLVLLLEDTAQAWADEPDAPLAATIALDDLPDDLDDIGEQVEHFPELPTLQIEPAEEEGLVADLRRRGYLVRRDDGLFQRINPYG